MKFRRLDVEADGRPYAFSSPAVHVMQTRAELLEVYGESLAAGLDLDNWLVIAVHRGLCRSGGFWVRVRDVIRNAGTVTVTVEMRDPEPGELVTLMMTEPYDMVSIPRDDFKPGDTLEFCFRDQDGSEIGRRTVIVRKPGG